MTQESPSASAARALPIYAYEEAIVEAVSDHPVIVVEGPTGSGKTTQLPRMLLRAGLSATCIGVTQPRRIAAVSVAWRLAEELGVDLGQEVGYAIRFDDRTSDRTVLKLMTDGILLQEARTDPEFSRYDVIIVDEAHERSLNIELTMGLLYRALELRDDLRVIISSATLQPERFQAFFQGPRGRPVPLISVNTRTYLLSFNYQPVSWDHPDEMAAAVAENVVRIHRREEPGHILVFLTGEAMIRSAEAQIYGLRPGSDLIVMPLYGRLTRQEQEGIFAEVPSHQRKVILSTNIAETSITIPGVRYVIDCGLAKIPRFNPKLKWTTLREEPISQASAAQRAGRAGRTAPGTVVRLFAEEELEQRPMYTTEEILRLDLTEVVLRLIDLGIREVERFHFPTPPSDRKLAAAIQTLRKLGAIDDQRNLTTYGQRMVRFPLSPQLARMVVEAMVNHPAVLDEALLAAACLSARSPFLFPQGEEREARQAQRAFFHPLGDIARAIVTFRAWQGARRRDQFAQARYLDPDILKFVDRAYRQLREIAEKQVERIGQGGELESVIECVGVGFVDGILRSQGRTFELPTGQPVSVHPSSALYGTRAPFVVATDVMRLHRTYAFQVSALTARQVARLSPELAKRWKLRKGSTTKRKRDDAPAMPLVPSELRLGDGVKVPVQSKGKKVTVAIPLAAVEAAKATPWSRLPEGAMRWRAAIVAPQGRFAHNTPLGRLLAMLTVMPLPGAEDDLSHDIPEGVLLESERTKHLLDSYHPSHIPQAIDDKIRAEFELKLPLSAMGRG